MENQSHIIYDCIGVGATAGAKFGELNDIRRLYLKYSKFNASSAVWQPEAMYNRTQVSNRDMFANLKAQSWWLLADRFRNTYNAIKRGQKFSPDELISISADCPHLEKIIDELVAPKQQRTADGKFKVESKDDMKKRGIPSPNLADALVMSQAPSADYSLLD